MGWRFKGNEIKYIKQVLDNDLRPKVKFSFNEKLEKLFSKNINKNMLLQLTLEHQLFI